jgi:hypothetical protein
MSETKHTPGPWGYVPSNENHGPYVVNEWGAGDICDCYSMTNPDALSVRNGGVSKPVHFQNEEADANARLIAAAPDLLEALKAAKEVVDVTEGMASSRSDDDFVWAAQKLIDAAIAKATGGAA